MRDEPDEILASAEEELLKLGEAAREALISPRQIIDEYEAA
jgi:hypothetical protein